MSFPAELQRLLDDVEACEREAERIVGELDDELVNRTPRAGGWSVAQCLNHLALINTFYLRGWLDALENARRAGVGAFTALQPTLPGRWLVRSMEPPVRMKTKTVRVVAPGPRFARDALVPAFVASHDEYRRVVRAAAGVDVNRVTAPNAFFRRVRMRLSTVLLVVPAHDRRHLWQAANVKRAIAGG